MEPSTMPFLNSFVGTSPKLANQPLASHPVAAPHVATACVAICSLTFAALAALTACGPGIADDVGASVTVSLSHDLEEPCTPPSVSATDETDDDSDDDDAPAATLTTSRRLLCCDTCALERPDDALRTDETDCAEATRVVNAWVVEHNAGVALTCASSTCDAIGPFTDPTEYGRGDFTIRAFAVLAHPTNGFAIPIGYGTSPFTLDEDDATPAPAPLASASLTLRNAVAPETCNTATQLRLAFTPLTNLRGDTLWYFADLITQCLDRIDAIFANGTPSRLFIYTNGCATDLTIHRAPLGFYSLSIKPFDAHSLPVADERSIDKLEITAPSTSINL